MSARPSLGGHAATATADNAPRPRRHPHVEPTDDARALRRHLVPGPARWSSATAGNGPRTVTVGLYSPRVCWARFAVSGVPATTTPTPRNCEVLGALLPRPPLPAPGRAAGVLVASARGELVAARRPRALLLHRPRWRRRRRLRFRGNDEEGDLLLDGDLGRVAGPVQDALDGLDAVRGHAPRGEHGDHGNVVCWPYNRVVGVAVDVLLRGRLLSTGPVLSSPGGAPERRPVMRHHP